jgi:hypothetical protein
MATPASGISPAALAPAAPAAGEQLTAAGFGRTNSEWIPTKRHAAPLTAGQATATELALSAGTAGSTSICKGDAGGPVLNSTGRLVALGSRSWQGGCLGTDKAEARNGAVGTRVDDLGAWIDQARGAVPRAHWRLAGQSGNVTPSQVGDFPATASNITWPSAVIDGRSTTYAAFSGAKSTISTGKPVVDTRGSFTFSTWVKPGPSGAVISQDNNRSSAFALFADPDSKEWRFAMSRADADGSDYDWAGITNPAARYTPDAWQHVTAVYNAATGLMSLYVDDKLAATGHHDAASSPTPTGGLVLGRYKQNGNAEFYHGGLTGGISNLAVYPFAAPPTTPGTTGKILLAAAPNNCADNDRGSTANGNKVQIWGCNEIGGGVAQQFEVRADGTIRNQGTCIDASGAGTANGTLIQLYTCHGHPAQQFLPRADGSIYNPVSGRCLDASNMTEGTQLYLWDCNQTNPQRWTIPALNTTTLPAPRW